MTIQKLSLVLLAAFAASACAADSPTQIDAPAQPQEGVSPRPAAPSSNATVYVVHGINGTDLGLAEALPVDITVNGACALQGFAFRGIAGPLALPAATYDIEVRLADAMTPCSGAVAIAAPGLALSAGADVSIVAHLNAVGAPTASVFANDLSRVPGRTRVAPRHAAAFGAVDVLVDGAVAFADVLNGQQGVADLRPGSHTIAITPAGTETRAFEATLALQPFTLYAAYAVGTPAKGTFEVLLQALPVARAVR